MPQSHDHNFKNLFLDFPKDALNWILPGAVHGDIIQPIELFGKNQKILLPKMNYETERTSGSAMHIKVSLN